MSIQTTLFGEVDSGAILSPDRRYRYRLWRIWEPELPAANFIMLNPSTADEREDDPTIRRCIGFARRLSLGGIVVTNLFAYRATDPMELRTVTETVGPENDRHIVEAARAARSVICAWGAFPGSRERATDVRRMLAAEGVDVFALRMTKGGDPAHPLYLPNDLEPIRWEVRKA